MGTAVAILILPQCGALNIAAPPFYFVMNIIYEFVTQHFDYNFMLFY